MPRRTEDAQRRPNRAPLRLYFTFFVGWVVASVLIVRSASIDAADTRSSVLAWFFVAGTGVLVAALVNRDAAARGQTDELLQDRQTLIESLGIVTDPRLTQLPLYQLLDDLLERAQSVLRADSASIYLLDREKGVLDRMASTADDEGATSLPLGTGVVGRVASTKRGVVATEGGAGSVVAAPLVAEGQLLGVLRLDAAQRRSFVDDDLRLLQVVADRAAVAIDARRLEREARRATLAAEGARARLAMLADAGAVLARPFDRVEAMADALGVALVPSFADWFAFHKLDDEGRPRLIAWQAGAEVDVGAGGGGDWSLAVIDAIAHAAPVLAWGRTMVGDAYRPARELGLSSLLIAPIVVRNETAAAMTFGTASNRRGYREGDVATANDLTARVGIAIERVLLGAQTQQSAVRAARHAAQLERLTEAVFAINAALASPNVVRVVAEQAAMVLEADSATVELKDGAALKERVGRVKGGSHSLSASLTDASGGAIGAIGVARAGAPFSGEEEAILSSLTQMASVALTNARLYATVQSSEARLRALYDASPVGIVELDAEGVGVRWNRAAEALFGWPPFEPSATRGQIVPPPALDIVSSVLRDGAPAAGDVTLGEDDDVRDVELVAVPLGFEEGHPDGLVVAAVDVTERKQVAEQLQQAQRMESMARMAGGIAHDFNNVLMVINGYADLLLRRDLEDPVRVDVEAMRAAATRAAQFTRQLLTISRRQVVQPLLVDVGETVRSLHDVLAVMVGSSVRVEVAVDDPPAVLVDPAQFEQVVLNLSLNAKDAMPDGGTLTIRATGADVDGVRWAEVVVADTGEGMDPATAEHCFEPFFTTKDRTKGTGLGLSTVYGVVTQAGGDITVASQPGEGTVFTIRLPAAPVAERVAPARKRPGSRAAEHLRVLVVDDEPDVRSIVADMLELDGHHVVAAADGAAALEALDRADPDVLLTDVVMPGMRGPVLAQEVLSRRPATKIILMSSHVDDAMTLEENVDGAMFLAKPFSAAALAETLATAVGGGLPAQDSKR